MKYFSESKYELMYGTEESAGLDLPFYDPDLECVVLQPGESKLLKTGIHLEIPKGHVGILDTRSSAGKAKLDLLCRTIDSDFRGNIRLMIINNNQIPIQINQGDYVAQIIIIKLSDDRKLQKVEDLEKLSTTARGHGGFGSTGNTSLV